MNTAGEKQALKDKRVALIKRLEKPMSPDERERLQGDLRLVNAQLKALHTTEAAQLKAAADRRKAAGMAEQHANTQRAIERAKAKVNGDTTPDENEADEDDDPGQTATIDGWIDALLLRNDVDFTRSKDGALSLEVDAKWAAVIGTLIDGVYAAARGQELPELPSAELRAVKAAKMSKTKPKKRP